MRIVMITDRAFGARERVMLSRLEVGLTQEGVRVIRAWPGSAPAGAPRSAFAHPISFADVGLPFTMPVRAARLVRALRAIESDSAAGRIDPDRPIDVIHAFGEGCWDIAAAVASDIDAAIALELWQPASLRAAERAFLRGGPFVAPGAGPSASRALLAPDDELADVAGRALPGVPVRICPWGVHVAEASRRSWVERMAADQSVSVAVIGSGEDERACAAALAGLADACRAEPRLIAFVDAAIVRRRRSLWRVLRDHKAVDRVSLVEGLESNRELTLAADIIMQPEALGQRRSITLDAMSAGVVLLARRESATPALRAPEAAFLISDATPAAWDAAIRTLLADPARADAFIARSAAAIRSRASPAAHVASVLAAYEWMAGAATLPFPRSVA